MAQGFRRISLRFWLLAPLVLQMVSTVGLVGYFSFRNGENSVNELSVQLHHELTSQIQQQLQNYSNVPFLINQLNAQSLAQGELNLTSVEDAASFWQQATTFPAANFIYCGRESDGAFLGVGRDPQQSGQRLKIQFSNAATHYFPQYYPLDAEGHVVGGKRVSDRPYDPRLRPWYVAAKQHGEQTWSEIYLDLNSFLPVITASQPVYDAQHKTLLGVCATDFLLSVELDPFLSQLTVGRSGEAFILERTGVLVSSSTSNEERLVLGRGKNSQRIAATQSQNPLVQATANYLIHHFQDLHQIRSPQQFSFEQHGKNLVRVVPFHDDRGLDWLIVVVLPESGFMEPVHANTRMTIFFCLVSLLIAMVVGIVAARWITGPLLRLNTAAKQIATGNWQPSIAVHRADEVGELAQSFNEMARQLHTTFVQKEELNQALAAHRDQLSQLLEALPIGIAVLYPMGVSYINRAGQRLLGIKTSLDGSLEQFLQTNQWYQAGSQQPYPPEQLPILQALQGKAARADDLEIHRSGQIISLETHAIPVFDAAGNTLYAISTFQDVSERRRASQVIQKYNQMLKQEVHERTIALQQEITERKQMELALRQSQEHIRAHQEFLKNVIDTCPYPIFVKNTTGYFLALNQACAEIYGKTVEEMLGKQDVDLNPDRQQCQEFQTSNQMVMATRQSMIFPEQAIQNAKGETRWYQTVIKPFLNTVGQVQGVIGACVDITERKSIETALKQREYEFRALVENAPDIIMRIDRNYRYLYINPTIEKHLGVTAAAIIGKRIDELGADAELIDLWITAISAAIDTQQEQMIEFASPSLTGTRYYASRIVPEFDQSGAIPSVLAIIRDISDRKEAETKLYQAKDAAEAASRAKSTFLANMSHELRTPLSAILGFAQLLLRDPALKGEQQQSLQIIDQSGKHLLDLINTVLDLSKIEAGHIDILESSFDLYQLLETVAAMLRHEALSKGLHFQVKIAADVPHHITMDAGKLRQVLINLMGNAIKFTDRGSITIKVALSDGRIGDSNSFAIHPKRPSRLRFEVQDTGLGIAPPDLDRIFAAFEQTHSGKQVSGGTGLGLTISRRFVELMGGELWVQSQLGVGSCFIFELPLREAANLLLDRTGESIPQTTEVEAKPIDLTTLAQLPPVWLSQLHQATLACDDDRILILLEQLAPEQHSQLQGLRQWVSLLQFDQILTALKSVMTLPDS